MDWNGLFDALTIYFGVFLFSAAFFIVLATPADGYLPPDVPSKGDWAALSLWPLTFPLAIVWALGKLTNNRLQR